MILWFQGSRERPSTMKPFPESHWGNSNLSSPIGGNHGFPGIFKESIPASIPSLFSPSRPSTVLWSVWTIIIYSVYRKTLRTWPHVFIKSSKGFAPALTDGYSSASISIKRRVVWILATLNHFRPNSVFWRMSHSVSCVSLNANISRYFLVEATA